MTAAESRQEPGTGTAGEGSARQLTTLRGWREFVADRPAVPDLLPGPAWELLDDDARLDYDEARLAHHAWLLTVATSTIQQVITEGRRLQYLNRRADAGRCGLILSGRPAPGRQPAWPSSARPSRRCTIAATRTRPGTSPSSTSLPRRPRHRG